MSKKTPVQVEVTLAKDHTHAGKAYKAGAKVKVSPPERDWLVRKQIVTNAPAPAATTGGAK